MSIQAGGITAYLDLDTGKFDSNLKKAQSGVGTFASGMQKTGGQMQKVGGKMTKGLTLPLLAVGVGALKVGMDFEAGMSEVAAISGATGDDLQGLEDLARDMGATTKFSATEAAEGLKYMAMAGWDSNQMAAALPAVLDLAAASGEDLGTTSDIVTDALTAFGMQAEDAAGFADLLASASSNSNTNVSLLGESFKYVAPVMGSLGVSADDTALALGLMANAGIKGSQAGTQLRTVMSNMIKPTKQQAAAMKRYGVEIQTNADGSVDLKGTMDNLRTTLGGLDETQQAAAASTIFGKEAMSGALAIVNASETDYQKLTQATTDYDGAAKKMADTMQDNLEGRLTKMKSGLEEAGIALSESLIPMMEKGVEGVQGLVDSFIALDDEQKENIVKWGLILAAAGPVLTFTGKLTSGIGSMVGVVAKLSGGLGAAGGTGLVGSLAALGPLAVGGVAIAGVVGINSAINDLRDGTVDLEEVNLDTTKSFSDQAISLQESINTFEQLTAKSNLTNKELAEMDDLNKRISQSSNPGEIKQLEEAYGLLAEKSGLSKEELEKLFEANTNIITQAPEVESSISSSGNAFVDNTEKAREYMDALYEMSLIELEAERTKNLANEKIVREQLTEEQRKMNELTEQHSNLQSAFNGEVEDSRGRIVEINDLLTSGTLTQEEQNVLIAERGILNAIENGDLELAAEHYTNAISMNQDLLDNQREKVDSIKDELAQIEAIDGDMANILLKQVGITEEGEKGLAQLDETMIKNQEELTTLQEKMNTAEGLTDEEKNRYKILLDNNNELQATKEYLYEELGIYKDLNALADMQVDKLSEEGRLKVESLAKSVGIWDIENDILGTLDKKSGKLSEEKKKLEDNRKANGANKEEIDKQIKSIDSKLGKQAQVKKRIMEELGIWDDVDKSIRDGIEAEIKKGSAVDGTSGKLDSQGNKIDGNNSKTRDGIGLERDRTAEAGKDVDKTVTVLDRGTVDDLNRRSQEGKEKPIDVKDFGSIGVLNRAAQARKDKPITSVDSGGSLSNLNKKAASPVRKFITFIGKGLNGIFADGTPPGGHIGGLALVGDGGGEELITLPSGRAFLSPATDTVMDLPKGTRVDSHRDTKRILSNVPKYAMGTNNSLNMDKYYNRPIEIKQNDNQITNIGAEKIADAIVKGLKKEGMTKDISIQIDGREIVRSTVNLMDSHLNNKNKEGDIGRGVTSW